MSAIRLPTTRITQWKAHTDFVSAVAFSPDGQWLASASWDKQVCLWRTSDWQLAHILTGHDKHVYCVAFHPRGNILASGANDHCVKLWDPGTGALLRTLEAHKLLGIDEVAFSPGGALLAASAPDGTVGLWKTSDWTLVRTLCGYERKPNRVMVISTCSIAFAPDGKSIAATEQGEHSVKLWRTANGKLVTQFGGQHAPVDSIAFSPNGRLLACALWDSTVHLHQTSDASPAAKLGKAKSEPSGFPGGRLYPSRLCAVAFSPDGALLAAGGWDKVVRCWAGPKWKAAGASEELPGSIETLAYSPDGAHLAAGLSDGTIVILGTA